MPDEIDEIVSWHSAPWFCSEKPLLAPPNMHRGASEPHGHGHGVFILATSPKGKWTTNPTPSFTQYPSLSRRQAADMEILRVESFKFKVYYDRKTIWTKWCCWINQFRCSSTGIILMIRLHAGSSIQWLWRHGGVLCGLRSRSRCIYFSNVSWRNMINQSQTLFHPAAEHPVVAAWRRSVRSMRWDLFSVLVTRGPFQKVCHDAAPTAILLHVLCIFMHAHYARAFRDMLLK